MSILEKLAFGALTVGTKSYGGGSRSGGGISRPQAAGIPKGSEKGRLLVGNVNISIPNKDRLLLGEHSSTIFIAGLTNRQ